MSDIKHEHTYENKEVRTNCFESVCTICGHNRSLEIEKPMSDIKQKAREILSNVEFLYGVPVKAPEKTIKEIESLIDLAIAEEREKLFSDQGANSMCDWWYQKGVAERDKEIMKYLSERKHRGFVKMKYVRQILNLTNTNK